MGRRDIISLIDFAVDNESTCTLILIFDFARFPLIK